jgi:hypothetical protein
MGFNVLASGHRDMMAAPHQPKRRMPALIIPHPEGDRLQSHRSFVRPHARMSQTRRLQPYTSGSRSILTRTKRCAFATYRTRCPAGHRSRAYLSKAPTQTYCAAWHQGMSLRGEGGTGENLLWSKGRFFPHLPGKPLILRKSRTISSES